VTESEIDDLVEQWHNSGSTMPLHEYLGITPDEYADYVQLTGRFAPEIAQHPDETAEEFKARARERVLQMTNVLSPPRNPTRRQLRKYYRACLVHAAGDRAIHPDCVVTAFYLDPWRNAIGSGCWDPSIGNIVTKLGVRIPRSLRALYSPWWWK